MNWSINTADISSLRNMKGAHSRGRRSIPRTAGTAHIDMYMREKEKERLQKEDASLRKRVASIQKRLNEINKELGAPGRYMTGSLLRKRVKDEKTQEKKWKKMKLYY
ncbi:MAG: hypothetical protein HY805_05110 [Nitrospirae bacterium]|nr:hypothetical protein [Nitrospirota bacterium]